MKTFRPVLFAAASLGAMASLTTAHAQQQTIVLSSTTSVDNSGLLPHILPVFTKETGIEVKVLALGTGQALDTAVAERLGQHARGDKAVCQRVAGPGGNLGAIGGHPPAAIRRARQIRRVKIEELIAHGPDAMAGSLKIRLGKHERGRQPAGTD